MLLLLHTLACAWIYGVCRTGKFVTLLDYSETYAYYVMDMCEHFQNVCSVDYKKRRKIYN